MSEVDPHKFVVGFDQLAQTQIKFNPAMANRHGLIAGATGTGKTVTLQILTEYFSRLGVPVFTADVKGDLSGLALAGRTNNKIQERIETIGLADFKHQALPTIFWDLYGRAGHPVRTTISEIGPVMLARLLQLNDTQEGVLQIAFKYADDQELLLLDLKDLQELLRYIDTQKKALSIEYGNIHSSTLAAIQRDLMVLEQAGGDLFFGEPAIDINDFIRQDFSGQGVVSILDARELMQDKRLYSTFLLWFLSELFETLPEAGDQPLPKLVFFFDEAHLLFNDAPKMLIEKIETVIRLIRSKGVGIFFVTQSPADIPESVLSQLGNRFQHALRAFTPKDQRAVRVAAQTFRANPAFSTEEAITELKVGEALVSLLNPDGSPAPVSRTLIVPPATQMGPIDDQIRQQRVENSPLSAKYKEVDDRESAYELLKQKVSDQEPETEAIGAKKKKRFLSGLLTSFFRSLGSAVGRIVIGGLLATVLGKSVSKGGKNKSIAGKVAKSVGRSMKNSVSRKLGNQIARGVLGSILK